jgi:hypothetical protein
MEKVRSGSGIQTCKVNKSFFQEDDNEKTNMFSQVDSKKANKSLISIE